MKHVIIFRLSAKRIGRANKLTDEEKKSGIILMRISQRDVNEMPSPQIMREPDRP